MAFHGGKFGAIHFLAPRLCHIATQLHAPVPRAIHAHVVAVWFGLFRSAVVTLAGDSLLQVRHIDRLILLRVDFALVSLVQSMGFLWVHRLWVHRVHMNVFHFQTVRSRSRVFFGGVRFELRNHVLQAARQAGAGLGLLALLGRIRGLEVCDVGAHLWAIVG